MTDHKPFRGIFPYLVSPLDADGRVRERVLRDVIRHVIAEGVQGISPLGSTGEFAYLTFEQRCEIVRIAVDEAAGCVPVVPGVAAYSISDAQRQAEAFVKLGADGLVLILQTLFPVSPRGIERYFSTVASSVPVPSVLYTNPGLLGGDIPHDVIEALSHVPNIRYIKDASGNTGRILSILNRVGGRIEIFSASAHIPLVVFQIGGVGWMAGPACVIPRQSVELYRLATAGRWDEAFALQKRLWAINELFQKYALAGCIKAALTIQGFDVGDPIAPQEPLKPEAVAEIRRVLDELKG
ncbi:MAG: dihydrodipicolinate synthase family protein [Chloroflexi bacterium]|nr:dihydrodipicolinate synthase family protein [Chloroflexota bacterium]